jgi:uncharacterized membrane protein YjgN (DUF898 family)
MAVTTLFIDEHDTAVISCTHCGRTKRIGIARFRHLHRPLKVKCACGQTFTAALAPQPQEVETPGEGYVSSRTSAPKTASAAPAEVASTQTHQLSFHGSSWKLFRLYVSNQFLTLLTLGFYQYWGRTKIRGYLLKNTDLEGIPFAYHGKGKEVLRGWLKAMVVFGIPLAGVEVFPQLVGGGDVLQGVSAFLAYGIMIAFMAIATLHTYRYRLSRTSWRGMPFSFRGRVLDFLKLYFAGILLTILTLGLYYPIFATKRYAFMTSHSYYGNQQFRFDGHGRDLFRSFLLTYVLLLPTMGMSWFWFTAAKQRYFWNHTSIASVQFSTWVTGRELLLLKLGNLFLLIATMGLARAWVKIRNLRFTLDRLTLIGSLRPQGTPQATYGTSTTAEKQTSFLALLEMDFDLG